MTTMTTEGAANTSADFDFNLDDILAADDPMAVLTSIEDPLTRVAAASRLCKSAGQAADDARLLRDSAALTLVWPWLTISDEFAARELAAKEAVDLVRPEPGEEPTTTYFAALAALDTIREQKNERLRDVVAPITVINGMRVSRNRWVRLRESAVGVPNPKVENAQDVMVQAAADIDRWVPLVAASRKVRDDAMAVLFADGSITNADIARATDLTSARIAQLRHPRPRAKKPRGAAAPKGKRVAAS